MATIRKNPVNPFKVATKMLKSATGRVKTAVKNTQKTSTRKTTSSSSAPVTGKSRVNTKLMDAATKNLPNVTVKAKKQPVKNIKGVTVKPKAKSTHGLFLGGKGSRDMAKLPKMDSTTFMNTVPKGRVDRNVPGGYKSKGGGSRYGVDTKQMALTYMRDLQKKYPGAKFSDFKFDEKTGSYLFKRY
jgi:hypothetical protein